MSLENLTIAIARSVIGEFNELWGSEKEDDCALVRDLRRTGITEVQISRVLRVVLEHFGHQLEHREE
jgi:hypothetical protein